MAQNKRPDADGLAALSHWAGINPADYVRIDPPPPARNGLDDSPHAGNGVAA
jgi:hypothetical protein